MTAVAVVAAGVGLLGVFAVDGDDHTQGAGPSASTASGSASSAAATGAAPSTSDAPTSPGPPGSPFAERRYAIATAEHTFVDTSRPTSPSGTFVGAPSRSLRTSFWFPSEPGTYPLVVFAHGYAVTPDSYAPMLERWAEAGYVVAAPTYPLLSGRPAGPSHVDYEQTLPDTSFVITQIAGLARDDPVGAVVDHDRVAVAGHSDGEVIAFGLGFFECCRDSRVRAVIAMAGDLANGNNPHVRDSGMPILHVMETGDEYDPYEPSIAWSREQLTAPRWLLTLNGATHVPPYQAAGDAHFELLQTVVVDFLGATLGNRPARLDHLAQAVAASGGLASLER